MTSLVIRKAYVEIMPGKQIHYRYVLPQNGLTQKPTIIYLHKSASSSVSYEKLMTHYASKGHPGYAPDMPGFGGSFDQDEDDVRAIDEENTGWYVDIFMKMFEKLGIYNPTNQNSIQGSPTVKMVNIIGHHSGASLANQLAARYPDFVRSITLVGATIIGKEERERMKEIYLKPFNKPAEDGSHLLKTWNYLKNMGVGDDISLHQREAVDHIRAWRGRMLVYGAVWSQESEEFFRAVRCPVLVLCARDDVLWEHVDNVQKVKPEAKVAEIAGGNFSLDRDVVGIVREWDAFQAEITL
ncbi:uncharacterized protein PV09_08011 [Verruconis gallopava]|uniref:AB hydrolase-1 domain-containing protein n=1 Tax=Verruconis gallopava TaxID=253628 RepID=A0A0D2A2E1_9PEZI|nr:uncharacterized protein PV09_08011 [Verruconis gallopava]KIW00490.1 hypothetical protein PV09_08011 [Verruconis gallopava]